MTETVFGLVTQYGVYVIFASAFLSCLALPIPTSLMMLTGGAFVAAGDLTFWTVSLAAYAGSVLGDQTGYFIGRTGGSTLVDRLARSPARAAVLKRARALVDRRGGMGVFLSTWAVAPLGPWVNFVAGATGLSWRRFTVADVLGETVWVTIYVGLGYVFMDQVSTVAEIMGDIIGLLASLAVVLAMVFWIKGVLRAKAHARHAARHVA
ncbi:DedA family protein [Pacificoceanicola onchidii]|uniref:DedA family protein n=1 Tax=Pacificoceanicola onchidii TaxID=2562685 RepID=UPI0010A391DF|nr:DedA family protein [Pacificoceanicola onchidii]